jgi:hypothetical protein
MKIFNTDKIVLDTDDTKNLILSSLGRGLKRVRFVKSTEKTTQSAVRNLLYPNHYIWRTKKIKDNSSILSIVNKVNLI